jgi:hypothetical protein
VVVSYDAMTLYADEVRLREKDLLLQTVGGNNSLVLNGVRKTVKRFSAIFSEKTVFLDLTDSFTESVKANVESKNISFELDVERDGNAKLVYTDRARGISLISDDDILSSMTIENPNKVTFSGYGILRGKGIPASIRKAGYSNFKVTVETSDKTRLRIEIPATNYSLPDMVLPRGSVEIRRDKGSQEASADLNFE